MSIRRVPRTNSRGAQRCAISKQHLEGTVSDPLLHNTFLPTNVELYMNNLTWHKLSRWPIANPFTISRRQRLRPRFMGQQLLGVELLGQ